jgi:RNA-directed DNA polymerase
MAGEQTVDAAFSRGRQALGREWPWLRAVAELYIAAWAGKTRPRRRDVIGFLRNDRGCKLARAEHPFAATGVPVAEEWLTEPQRMLPAPAALTWPVPAIESVGELADWLAIDTDELAWFADIKGLAYKQRHREQLTHYRYRVLLKRSGSVRVIEAPKSRLKELQRRILTGILDRIPIHGAVHGFVRGRSIRSFVAPHVSRPVLLRMDLQDFFPSLPGARIQALFRTVGYPEAVADLLGGLCTNAARLDATVPWETRALYARPHVPQGAPSSPALANICAWRVDCRLAGIAKAAGAEYTRYADDLAFSGDAGFERRVERFSVHVAAILLEEGFYVNHRKTRIMRSGVRQHLAGLVTNQRVNVARRDFEILKATLHNCVREGAESQNRSAHPTFRAHLEGRVSFVESIHPAKGLRLRAMLERIAW